MIEKTLTRSNGAWFEKVRNVVIDKFIKICLQLLLRCEDKLV